MCIIKKGLSLVTELAKKNQISTGYHHAAVIMKKGTVISVGFNSKKTHTMSKSWWNWTHAELDAIVGVDRNRLNKAIMFVGRMGYSQRLTQMLSKPCIFCQQIIREKTGISKVIYTLHNEGFGIWKPNDDY